MSMCMQLGIPPIGYPCPSICIKIIIIYFRWQLPMNCSLGHRITGCALTTSTLTQFYHRVMSSFRFTHCIGDVRKCFGQWLPIATEKLDTVVDIIKAFMKILCPVLNFHKPKYAFFPYKQTAELSHSLFSLDFPYYMLCTVY